jgi:hypothetical protein
MSANVVGSPRVCDQSESENRLNAQPVGQTNVIVSPLLISNVPLIGPLGKPGARAQLQRPVLVASAGLCPAVCLWMQLIKVCRSV